MTVSFGPGAELFEKYGLQLYPEQALLRASADGPERRFSLKEGELSFGAISPGLPKDSPLADKTVFPSHITVSAHEGPHGLVVETKVEQYATDVRFFRMMSRQAVPRDPEWLTPLGAATELRSEMIASRVAIFGVSDEAIDSVRESIDAVAKKFLAVRETQMKNGAAEIATLQGLSKRLRQGVFRLPPASDQRVIGDIKALIAPNDRTVWS